MGASIGPFSPSKSPRPGVDEVLIGTRSERDHATKTLDEKKKKKKKRSAITTIKNILYFVIEHLFINDDDIAVLLIDGYSVTEP